MESVLKWVDETTQKLADIGWREDKTVKDSKEIYIPEYKRYALRATVVIIQLDKTNKECFIRRLFRPTPPFFHSCLRIKAEVMRDKEKDLDIDAQEWIYDTECKVWDGDCSLKWGLIGDLLLFYEDIIELCEECNLNPIELCPYDYAKEIIEDIQQMPMYSFKHNYRNNIGLLERLILKDSKKVLKAIDAIVKNSPPQKKLGKDIALIICALEKHSYIPNTTNLVAQIYRAFTERYPQKIGAIQGINAYIEATKNRERSTSDYKPFTDKELDKFISTVIEQ